MEQILRVFIFLALFFCTVPSVSQPKIGLAFGGGGAKGAAAIGVLKVIEKAGVKVDYIAGTSIGAVIGGLYASGYSTAEMEILFLSQEWQDVLEGHRVDAKLKSLLTKRNVRSFEDTRIPFKCVAAKQKTMEEVVLSSGVLSVAIRASMSIPKLYEPVKWGNTFLIDGGVINNLPVDVVRNMGADIVIAIDLQQGREISIGISPKSLFGIGGLIDWLFTRPDISRRLQNIKDADIHIRPRLPAFTAMSFGRDNCKLMMRLGEEAAQAHWEELKELRSLQ